jgi:hypothetical protein
MPLGLTQSVLSNESGGFVYVQESKGFADSAICSRSLF